VYGSSTRILPSHLHQQIPNHSRLQPQQRLVNSTNKTALQLHQQITTTIVDPKPQDVLCIDLPNVQHFQGNCKLLSIAKKIAGHYLAANQSVKTMIVGEIATRIQKTGSRFLKLAEDGMTWKECDREEIMQKVTSCFEVETPALTTSGHSVLQNTSAPSPDQKNVDLVGSEGVTSATVASSLEGGKRMQEPPCDKDVVLRGGPLSEKEGNTYLITMIQANVGLQVDSYEMKRIKCRAILERMNKRGSRFFLKLKETDTDDDLYCLSDTEAQDVIYTAFCAEEEKVQQSLLLRGTTSSMHHSLAGANGSPELPTTLLGSQLGSQLGSLRADATLLNQMATNSSYGLPTSQAAQSAFLTTRSSAGKRLLDERGHLSTGIYKKRLQAETDEQLKMIIEKARQEQSSLADQLPSTGLNLVGDSSSAYGSSMDQLLKERGLPPSSVSELPQTNNQYVELLKKKYAQNQKMGW